jgi:cytochrome oxidase Cu insertion factor (SCO1/SenC/PrrC family)
LLSPHPSIRHYLLVIAAVFLPGDLTGQSYVELKEAMEQTTVNENVGGEIPLKSRFMALDGNWYNLGEFFFEDRPVFLSLNYADCPQLCKNQLKTLAERFTEAKLVPGTDFEFISISLDPKEAHKRTREAKANFADYWAFLPTIKGFTFSWAARVKSTRSPTRLGLFTPTYQRRGIIPTHHYVWRCPPMEKSADISTGWHLRQRTWRSLL